MNGIYGSVDDLTNFALRLVSLPSPSGHEDGVAKLVHGEMSRLGLDVEVDEWGNVIGSVDAGEGPCVLLDAHMDTVGVTEPQRWVHNPSGERVGDRLYGRGTMDMKGPMAAAIYGVSMLKGRLRRGRVVVSATVAEELVEGPALIHVARYVRPNYVIICEATSLCIARGQRGRAEIRLEVSGRSTHSSRPEFGINAAQAMVDVVRALRDIVPPRHEVLGEGILTLTDIKSEPYPGMSVVPSSCVATFDRRTLPGETEEQVLEPIRTASERALTGSGAEIHVSIARADFQTYTASRVLAPKFAPAWFLEERSMLVKGALDALADVGIPARLSHYAFCTNGSGTAGRLEIPTIGFGPGNEELAHRVDEHIEAGDLAWAARGYAAIAARLAEAES